MAKKTTQVVIQSFVPYAVEVNFRHVGGDLDGQPIKVGLNTKTVRVPAKGEKRDKPSILVLTSEDFAAVKVDLDPYLDLGQRGGMTILEDIPSGYWDPAERVASAEAARQMAEGALAGANGRIAELEARVEELKGILTETYAWKDDGK